MSNEKAYCSKCKYFESSECEYTGEVSVNCVMLELKKVYVDAWYNRVRNKQDGMAQKRPAVCAWGSFRVKSM